ncbi:hypothetical protein Tco_0603562 [Tanacetum coccineum]
MLPLHFTYASTNWSFSCALCSDYDDVTPSDTYSVQAPSGGVTDQVKLTLGVMDLDHALRIDPPTALTAESTADQKRAYE